MTVRDVIRAMRWQRSGGLIVPRYLGPTSLKYVGERLSHKDAFGRPLSEAELIGRLEGVSRSAMLSAIGQFMLRMSAGPLGDPAFQQVLIEEMLPAVTRARVKALLRRRRQKAVFDPQGAMALAKMALRHSPETGHSPQQMRAAFDALPSLTLAATDALDARVDVIRKTRDEEAGAEWLRNHVIRMVAFTHSPQYGHEAARYSRLFLRQAYESRSRRLADWMDIGSAFADVVGYGLEDYLAAGLALVAFQMPKNGSVDPPRACIRPRRWLRGFPTDHGRQVMASFLGSVSAPAHRLGQRISSELDMEFFYDFSVFEKTPLVRVPGGLVCTIQHQWLCEAVTSGVYWRLRNGLGTERKQRFCRFMGHLFEMYVSDLLTSCLPAGSVFDADMSKKKGGTDFAVFLERDAFFFEAATSHLQKHGTEVAARTSAVERDLADLARKASQAIRSAVDFADGRTRYTGVSARAVRRIWPVVVTLHHVPVDPFTLKRLRRQAVEGISSRPTIHMPLFVDAGELEDLCSLVESGRDLPSVIHDWVSDPDQCEWPLANLLGARGATRPLVRLLTADLQKLADGARSVFGGADS